MVWVTNRYETRIDTRCWSCVRGLNVIWYANNLQFHQPSSCRAEFGSRSRNLKHRACAVFLDVSSFADGQTLSGSEARWMWLWNRSAKCLHKDVLVLCTCMLQGTLRNMGCLSTQPHLQLFARSLDFNTFPWFWSLRSLKLFWLFHTGVWRSFVSVWYVWYVWIPSIGVFFVQIGLGGDIPTALASAT